MRINIFKKLTLLFHFISLTKNNIAGINDIRTT